MFFTFGYAYPLITDEWAGRFVENFKGYMKKVSNPSKE
jgi:hypothetical protein